MSSCLCLPSLWVNCRQGPSERRQDTGKAAEIEAWIDRLTASSQVLPMDTECFREWGRIVGRMPEHLLEDAMIAATARVHGLVVATRNVKDFRQLAVRIFDPFVART